MRNPIRLSICIPTYNFGEFIGETLQSIVPQLEHGVEIVVLDGGSTDNTAAVVESFQRGCPSLRYERREERGGIDRDMARTVELASGEYCWLFCADDIMRPGAIRQMLENLRSGCDVYLCGMTLCTFDMQPLRDHPVSRIKTASQFDLGRAPERRRYFRHALTTTAFFSFAGSLTFRKSRWDAVGLNEDFVGSLWAHVARFFEMIPQGLRLHYLPGSYLLKRTDNDSFMDKGLVHRTAIAIDGYHRLADAYFSDGSVEARHVRRAVMNEYPLWFLLDLRFTTQAERPVDAAEVDRLAAKVYGASTPKCRAYRLLYRHTPRPAFACARTVFRLIRAAVGGLKTRRRPVPQAAGR